MNARLIAALALVSSSLGWAHAGPAGQYVLPMCVDPPIVIDGELHDWARVPNPIPINRREQATDGESQWGGADDLSGIVHLAWRDIGLFVAAEVTDDTVVQASGGKASARGDHVSVLMDLAPDVEPTRSPLGAGQCEFSLSPGSLDQTGDGKPLPPAMHVRMPAHAPAEGGQIVARKTDTGYVIEAFVPWSRLGVERVTLGKNATFEVALSDADAASAKQQTWMTSVEAPWSRTRQRLLPMVFGDGNGRAAGSVSVTPLAAAATVLSGKERDITFVAPAIPSGHDPFVFFTARIHRDQVSGFTTRALGVTLNGSRLGGDRIANRPVASTLMDGRRMNCITPDGAITLPYAPGGEAFDRHPAYALLDGVKGCEFEFNVAGLAKEGENTLRFENLNHSGKPGEFDATIENVEWRMRPHVEKTDSRKPAPTGELPTYEPQAEFPKTYSGLERKGAEISFTIGGEPFTVTSGFTAPDGTWHAGSSRSYKHDREVVEHDEWIEVRDTFTNLTDEHVPVMQKHACAVGPDRARGVWLSGLRIPSGEGRLAVPENPSVFVATETAGVGLLALNDEFRVHSEQAAAGGSVDISDNQFVLEAKGTYTAEWAIIPIGKPDVWAFVNAARRVADVNFPMTLMTAFLEYRGAVKEWTDEQYRQFLGRKSANVVCDSLYFTTWQGRHPQGIAFQKLVEDPAHARNFLDAHERVRRAFPDGHVKFAIYYHCYIDVMDESVEKYADARRLDIDGKQMVYGFDYDKLYLPTLENDFGKEIAKGIDLRLDTLGANAFYWDEYNASRGDYTYTPAMWDRCSGDIDRKTFKLLRPKSSVHLLSLPFLEHHIRRVVDRVPAFFNGAPYSRTLAKLRFQAFTETGSISNCHRMLLYSPVALGDHLTEMTQQDCYRVMLQALDWGCLYAWYPSTVFPTHETLTEHMFPSTPIELHEGFLIARERIVTNRSGLFGWGDASDFTVHVYDHEGRHTEGREAKKTERDGKTYAELRMPEGYSAAIVRSAP